MFWFLAAFLLLISPGFTATAATPRVKSKPSRLNSDQRAASRILRSMSLRDRVAQMIVGVSYGDVPAKQSAEYKNYV
ncbi:MAG: hypothetical protein ACRD30_09225, partial [Bryobacteraceae bacterium]